MKIYLATDHAGFELKEKVKAWLLDKKYDVVDEGNLAYDKDDDYPDFVARAARAVSEDTSARGIVFGWSGQGEAMVANRFRDVRAAVYAGGGSEIVKLAREHNDANILSLGAHFVGDDEALKMIELFLETAFSQEIRHERRIRKIEELTLR